VLSGGGVGGGVSVVLAPPPACPPLPRPLPRRLSPRVLPASGAEASSFLAVKAAILTGSSQGASSLSSLMRLEIAFLSQFFCLWYGSRQPWAEDFFACLFCGSRRFGRNAGMWWSRGLGGIMRAGRVGDDGRQVCLGMSMDRDANVGSYLRSKALLTVVLVYWCSGGEAVM